MTSKTTRRLIWVPIIHTQADLGSVSGAVKALYARKIGLKGWNRRVATIDDLWRRTREEIQSALGGDMDYRTVRLYQDGLPNCGYEFRIVRDMIEAGSMNHRLLLELMEKGARLMGTESPELLIEEYELVRGVLRSLEEKTGDAPLNTGTVPMLGLSPDENGMTGQSQHRDSPCRGERPLFSLSGPQASRSKDILRERDRYIAGRIADTLEPGETGLVFLGMLHRLRGLLPRDIGLSMLSPWKA